MYDFFACCLAPAAGLEPGAAGAVVYVPAKPLRGTNGANTLFTRKYFGSLVQSETGRYEEQVNKREDGFV